MANKFSRGNIYRSGQDVIKIEVQDCTGRTISRDTCAINDENSFVKMIGYIIEKYSLDIGLSSKNTHYDKYGADFNWKS